jgi:hypothetical protein
MPQLRGLDAANLETKTDCGKQYQRLPTPNQKNGSAATPDDKQ